MSEDTSVMKMVNDPEKSRAVDARFRNGRRRGFWKMARRALLWILAGALLILLMYFGQIAVWLAASCTCACVVAAAVTVDRFIRGGRYV